MLRKKSKLIAALLFCCLILTGTAVACKSDQADFSVTLQQDIVGGRLIADKYTVKKEGSVTITAVPADGYVLDWIKINGTEAAATENRVVVTAVASDLNVTAQFVKGTYSITVFESDNGSVTADKTAASMGETVTLTVSPERGYRLKKVEVTAGNTEIVYDSTANTFVMPASSVVVSAEFEENRLATPQLTFDKSTQKVTWAAVSNAQSYSVQINEEAAFAVDAAAALEVNLATEEGRIEVKVTAKGDYTATSGEYRDSETAVLEVDKRLPASMNEVTVMPDNDARRLVFSWENAVGAVSYEIRVNSASESAWQNIGSVTEYSIDYPDKAGSVKFEIRPIGDDDHTDGETAVKTFVFPEPVPETFGEPFVFATAGTFSLGTDLKLPTMDTSDATVANAMTMTITRIALNDKSNITAVLENAPVASRDITVEAGYAYEIEYSFTNAFGFVTKRSQTVYALSSEVESIENYYGDIYSDTTLDRDAQSPGLKLDTVNGSEIAEGLIGDGKLVHFSEGSPYQSKYLLQIGKMTFPSGMKLASQASGALTEFGFLIYNDSDVDVYVIGFNKYYPYTSLGAEVAITAPVVKAKSFYYYRVDQAQIYSNGFVDPTTGILLTASFDIRSENYEDNVNVYISAPFVTANMGLKLDTPQLVREGNTVTWAEVPFATGYKVSTDGVTWTDANDRSYTYTGNEYVNLRVKAVSDRMESNVAEITIDVREKFDAPTGVTVADNGSDGYTISWNAVPNAERYLYRLWISGAWTEWKEIDVTTITVLYNDLKTTSDLLKAEVSVAATAGYAQSDAAEAQLALEVPTFDTVPPDRTFASPTAEPFLVYIGDSSKPYYTELPTGTGEITFSVNMLHMDSHIANSNGSGGTGALYGPVANNGENGFLLYESFMLEITYSLTSAKGVVSRYVQYIGASHYYHTEPKAPYTPESLVSQYPDFYTDAELTGDLSLYNEETRASGILGDNILALSGSGASLSGVFSNNVYVGKKGSSGLRSMSFYVYNDSDVAIEYQIGYNNGTAVGSGEWYRLNPKTYGYHGRLANPDYVYLHKFVNAETGMLEDITYTVRPVSGSAEVKVLFGELAADAGIFDLAKPVVTVSEDGSSFSWTAVPGAEGYEYSLDDGKTWTPAAELQVTGYAAGVHTVRVRATAAHMNAGVSDPVTADYRPQLAAPTEVTLTDNENDGFTLTWINSDNASSYEYSLDGTNWIPATNGMKLTYAELFKGKAGRYTVQVRANADNYASSLSGSTDVTVTAPVWTETPADALFSFNDTDVKNQYGKNIQIFSKESYATLEAPGAHQFKVAQVDDGEVTFRISSRILTDSLTDIGQIKVDSTGAQKPYFNAKGYYTMSDNDGKTAGMGPDKDIFTADWAGNCGYFLRAIDRGSMFYIDYTAENRYGIKSEYRQTVIVTLYGYDAALDGKYPDIFTNAKVEALTAEMSGYGTPQTGFDYEIVSGEGFNGILGNQAIKLTSQTDFFGIALCRARVTLSDIVLTDAYDSLYFYVYNDSDFAVQLQTGTEDALMTGYVTIPAKSYAMFLQYPNKSLVDGGKLIDPETGAIRPLMIDFKSDGNGGKPITCYVGMFRTNPEAIPA